MISKFRRTVLWTKGTDRLVMHQNRGFVASYQIERRSWDVFDLVFNAGWTVLFWGIDKLDIEGRYQSRITLETEFDSMKVST